MFHKEIKLPNATVVAIKMQRKTPKVFHMLTIVTSLMIVTK